MDRLSALPDCLLVPILHRLGLKEAAKAALFSKQWRFLWTNLPLYFCERINGMEKIRRFVAHVDAVLAPLRDHPLGTLIFFFPYNKNLASDVDRWLDFAAKNKLKSFSLLLQHDFTVRPPQNHTLPQFIYTILSLTRLHLERCTIQLPPQTAVDWPCLKQLSLVLVKSSQQAFDKIATGCPLLESSHVGYCDGIERLEIGGRSFRRLTLTSYDSSDLKQISMPYMRDLSITVCFRGSRKKLQLENVQSLESATICLNRSKSVNGSKRVPVDKVRCYTMELFKDLHHVENLSVDSTDSKNSIDWKPYMGDDLTCDLLHLKTIMFEGFQSLDLRGEPISTLAQILFKEKSNFGENGDLQCE
ncbi:hypothetical protein OROMI_025129 [Orobanche minor]